MARDAESFIKPFVVSDGGKFKLKDHDPAATRWVKSKQEGRERLQKGIDELCELQERLYAQDINPQGCQVHPFKSPSAEELDHDFLPPELVSKKIWKERGEDINAFERYLARNGYIIRKFFLNVSKKEQKRRFPERLTMPDKNWKFSLADAKERGHWDDYMDAYEDAIRRTATPEAPWVIVPADNKWFARLVAGAAVIPALRDLKLEFPVVEKAKKSELDSVRVALEGEERKQPKAARKTVAP